MKNQTNKRATKSWTGTLLTATALALALTAGAPVAGSFEASTEGRAEAQFPMQRKFQVGWYRLCLGWCYHDRCCWESPHRPFELMIEGR